MSRSQKNVQDSIKHVTNFQNVVKYKFLSIMTITFIVVIISILAASLYLTVKSTVLKNQLTAYNQARYSFHIVNYDIFRIKYYESEDLTSGFAKTIIDEIKDEKDRLNNAIDALENGGKIEDSVKKDVLEIKKLAYDTNASNKESLKHLLEAKGEWQKLDRFVANFTSSINRTGINKDDLDQAIKTSASLSKKINESLRDGSRLLDNRFNKYSDISNLLQIIGIVLTSLYFLFFFWYTIYRLETSNEEAELLKIENQKLMETVKEGLFFLDNKMIIRPNYSRETERIVGRSHLGGMNFIEVIRNMISNSEISLVESFIDQLFTRRVNEKLIDSLNPLGKVAIHDDVKKDEITRYLQFNFNRLVKDKEIISLLVCVEDITQQIKMEEKLIQEREEFDQKLEVITSMIHMDKNQLKNIMVVTKQSILKINEILKHPGKTKQDFDNKIRAINMVVTELETRAREVRFDEIVRNCYELSQDLVELNRSRRLVGDDFLSITISLDKLLNLLLTIDSLCLKTGIFEKERPRKKNDDIFMYGPQQGGQPLNPQKPSGPIPPKHS